MALKVVPTKGNLISTKKQLQLAVLGYDLLDKKRNVLIKEMMSLLDDVKMVRDEITEAYQNAYDALQEANISLGLISDLVTATPIDYGISIWRTCTSSQTHGHMKSSVGCCPILSWPQAP